MGHSWDTESRPTPGSCIPRKSAAGTAGRKCRSSAPGGDSTEQNPEARSPGRRPGSESLGVVTRVDRDRRNDHRVDRAITSSGPYLGDLVDHVAAGLVGDLAEDGVLPVEMWLWPDSDEELRAIGTRTGV